MKDDPGQIYRRATEVDPQTAGRLRDRARTRLEERPRRSFRAPLAVVLATAIGAAIVFWARPVDEVDPPATLPLAHVQLSAEPPVGGTRAAPVLQWDDGLLDVKVTPHQGVDLTVSTPEATIRVVGTVFSVDRSHRATRVTVTEGTVRVTCIGGQETPVHGGDERTCLPADPASLLIRLAELNRSGASATERLETATAGLGAVDADSPVRAELLAHRTLALADAGRIDEALGAAEDYLASGDGPRRSELLSFVARTRYGRDGCAAIPALERAVRDGPPGPESLLLATCLVESDPATARTLVENADGWATGEWRRVADDLRIRLGR